MIIAAPLNNANGYLVISTLFTYARTFIGCRLRTNLQTPTELINTLVLLGIGLLAAPWLKSFRYGTQPWRPRGSRLGLWTIIPLVTIFSVSNLFVLVFSWWPSDLQKSLKTKASIVPSVTGPILGTGFLVAGAVYWVWDLHILRWLGYTTEVMAETQDESELDVQMYFHVSHSLPFDPVKVNIVKRNINGIALRVYEVIVGTIRVIRRACAWAGRYMQY